MRKVLIMAKNFMKIKYITALVIKEFPMKNTTKHFGEQRRRLYSPLCIIILMACFILLGCSSGEGAEGAIFTSIAAFADWLSSQPANTPDTAYKVTLNLKDLVGDSYTIGSLGNVLSKYYTKYVNLNLSPSTIPIIVDKAFSECKNLTGVTIGNNVISIGELAFSSCSSLASVTIGISVASIGRGAFGDYTSLTSVTVDVSNPNYSSVGGILYNKTETKIIMVPRGITGNVTIPNSVINIGSDDFHGCTSLTSVTIGNSVTSIGGNAFHGCTGLTSVTIPNSVTSIGNWAFYNCTGLTSVTIGNSVTSIRERAFDDCTNLISVTIPNSVTSIGRNAFYNCTSLTSVTFEGMIPANNFGGYESYNLPFPGDLRTKYLASGIGTYTTTNPGTDAVWTKQIINGPFANIAAFTAWLTDQPDNTPAAPYIVKLNVRDLSGIANMLNRNENKYVYLDLSGSTITTIPEDAFYETFTSPYKSKGCATLTGITIPNSVIGIGNDAFAGCISLTSVTIPNGVFSIGNDAFFGCISLTSVTIPNNVISIGDGAFSGCANLTAINVDSGNATYNSEQGVLYNKNKTLLHTYPGGKAGAFFTIPNSVTSIGSYTFFGCTSLINITIPNSVTSIGERAFYECSGLTSVAIPNGVTSIGKSAFYGCSRLISVTFGGTIPASGFSTNDPFPGDLRTKFYATNSTNGTPGTYTRPSDGTSWTRQ